MKRLYCIKTICLITLTTLTLLGCGTLSRSAANGDLDGVKKYLARGADINATDRYGYTPLIWATYYNYYPVVKFLLEEGADPDVQEKNGQSALIMASYYGHVGIARLLLRHGADMGLADRYGNTALAYAEQYSHDEIIRLLEGRGARNIKPHRDTALKNQIIYLKDGSKIVGKILSQNRTEVKVRTKYTTITIQKEKIREMRYK